MWVPVYLVGRTAADAGGILFLVLGVDTVAPVGVLKPPSRDILLNPRSLLSSGVGSRGSLRSMLRGGDTPAGMRERRRTCCTGVS